MAHPEGLEPPCLRCAFLAQHSLIAVRPRLDADDVLRIAQPQRRHVGLLQLAEIFLQRFRVGVANLGAQVHQIGGVASAEMQAVGDVRVTEALAPIVLHGVHVSFGCRGRHACGFGDGLNDAFVMFRSAATWSREKQTTRAQLKFRQQLRR